MKALSLIHDSVIKLFLYLCPFGLGVFVLLNIPGMEQAIFANKFWGPTVAVPFGFWLLSSQYFLISLIFSKKFRESILMKMAFIKERDERESIIVGKAAKSTFLLTLGVSIFLIAVSTLRYDMATDNSQVPGRVTIGSIDFSGVKVETYKYEKDGIEAERPLHKLPISNTALFTLLLVIQVMAFHYFSKRSLREF